MSRLSPIRTRSAICPCSSSLERRGSNQAELSFPMTFTSLLCVFSAAVFVVGTNAATIFVAPSGRAGAGGTEAAGHERPVFDFSGAGKDRRAHGFSVTGDHWHLTGIEVTSAAGFGISVTGHHNTIERCRAHANQNTGINLGAPASDTLVLDCESYRNVDYPTRGQNADGFGAKFDVGSGNVFRGCRAWENADDGFDLWKAPTAQE